MKRYHVATKVHFYTSAKNENEAKKALDEFLKNANANLEVSKPDQFISAMTTLPYTEVVELPF
jgi:hypothetical protein